jgi:hypothetical protein
MANRPQRPRDERLLATLQPYDASRDAGRLERHMDACVAAAVGLGLTVGAALAVQGAVLDRFAHDLVRADHELVRSLSQLLGMA